VLLWEQQRCQREVDLTRATRRNIPEDTILQEVDWSSDLTSSDWTGRNQHQQKSLLLTQRKNESETIGLHDSLRWIYRALEYRQLCLYCLRMVRADILSKGSNAYRIYRSGSDKLQFRTPSQMNGCYVSFTLGISHAEFSTWKSAVLECVNLVPVDQEAKDISFVKDAIF
jgi:hypothetical protein